MPHGDRGLTDSPHQSYAENNAVEYNFYIFSYEARQRLGRHARSVNAWGS